MPRTALGILDSSDTVIQTGGAPGSPTTTRVSRQTDRDNWRKIVALTWYDQKACSGDLALTTSYADVTGCTLTLEDPGVYHVTADVAIDMTAGSAITTNVRLEVGGTAQSGELSWIWTATAQRWAASYTWQVTTTSKNKAAVLRAKKSAATGTFNVKATDTRLLAKRIA